MFAVLKVFVSAALIFVLLYIMRGKYADIGKVLRNASLPTLGVAVFFFMCAIAMASLRLKIICRAQDIETGFGHAFSLNFIGYFFNNFLPSAIGGDFIKAYYLSQKTAAKMHAYTSIFIDRVVGLLTMVFMAFAAIFFVGTAAVNETVRYMIYGITLASLIAILFIINKKFAKKFSGLLDLLKPIKKPLGNAYDILNRYARHRSILLQSVAISVGSQSLFFISVAFLSLSIGFRIPLVEIFLRMPIIGMISLLPSINGLGVREGSTVVFFGPLIGKENAFAVSILWFLMLFITSVLGGLIYAMSPQFRVKLKTIKET